MSKAFTKEDDGGQESLPLPPRPPSGEKRYITPEGYRALQEELAALTGTAGEEEAPALGKEARDREHTRRIQLLTLTLESVQVVSPEAGSEEDRVYFGAWVTLEDEEGQETTYRIVGPDEADVRAGRLSVESPLARALLGREVGEAVQVERPRGSVEYTVVRVSYRHPEA